MEAGRFVFIPKKQDGTNNVNDDQLIEMVKVIEDKKQKEVFRWVKEKQKDMYIKIEGQYRNCKFDFPDWLKTN